MTCLSSMCYQTTCVFILVEMLVNAVKRLQWAVNPSSSPHHHRTAITPVKLRLNKKRDQFSGPPKGSGALFKTVKAKTFYSDSNKPLARFLIPVHLWVSCDFCAIIILKSNHAQKYMFIHTAVLPTVKQPDPDCNGSAKWWSGVSSIKRLCLKLVQICSNLYHPTSFFLSNFLSGKVRESWTGEGVS